MHVFQSVQRRIIDVDFAIFINKTKLKFVLLEHLDAMKMRRLFFTLSKTFLRVNDHQWQTDANERHLIEQFPYRTG